MKAKLVANPSAGRDRASSLLVTLNERLRPAMGGELDLVVTVAPGDAARAAELAAEEGSEVLFVAGGDGTLDEVVQGVARVPGALDRVTFGLVPLGTGNDFAHALGLPEDVDAALDTLGAGRVVHVDLGALGERVFVNASAGGFVAEVSRAVDPKLKTLAGKLAYVLGGAGALFEHEPTRLEVTLDDDPPFEIEASLFAVCNGRTIGGGHAIAPEAFVDDGLLDLCIVRGMGTLDLVQVLAEIARAEHVADERVLYRRIQRAVIATTDGRPLPLNVDGEVLELPRAVYEVRPRAARFFAGPDLPWALNR